MTVAHPFRIAAGLAALAFLFLAGSLESAPVQTPEAEPTPARARTHLVVGELARLDLGRRLFVVKVVPPAGAAFEIEMTTDEATRISARGRALSLSEMRPGERVLVSCSDEGPRHRAVLVKMGAAPKNEPATPRPAPSPAGP